MLIETLAVLGAGAAGAAGLRYLWRLAAGEDQRRAAALEAERLRWWAQIHIEHARATAAAPAPHTYAPHISYHAGSQSYAPHLASAAARPAAASPEARPPDESRIPDFAQLLATGQVGTPDTLLLGFEAGAARYGAWTDMYSTAVAGKPGTGKSTSQRFYACQTALSGARFVVCDPHYGAGSDSLGESLHPLLEAGAGLCEVASSEADIVNAVLLVQSIGKARTAGDPERTPIILWIDEATALLNRSEIGGALGALLEAIAQEYRKVGVYASISGQLWSADRMPSSLKHSLASVLAHRMHRDVARALLPSGAARYVEGLEAGQALFYKTNGDQVLLTIPNTTARDVELVATRLTSSQPSMPRLDREAQVTVAREGGAASSPRSSGSEAELPPNVARVFALMKGGQSLSSSIKEVYACEGGRKYTAATQEVSQWMTRFLP